MKNNDFNPAELDLKEKVVQINRVAKTVKGGRNMRFSCLVVVGDGAGHVGVGLGKAIEIPEAIQLAMQSNETLAAKKQPPFRSIIFRINSLFIMLPPLFIPLY